MRNGLHSSGKFLWLVARGSNGHNALQNQTISIIPSGITGTKAIIKFQPATEEATNARNQFRRGNIPSTDRKVMAFGLCQPDRTNQSLNIHQSRSCTLWTQKRPYWAIQLITSGFLWQPNTPISNVSKSAASGSQSRSLPD